MTAKSLNKTAYQKLITDISAVYDRAMKDAGAAVDDILKNAYWEIGRLIVQVQQKGELHAEYGRRLLENLASDLSQKNPKGFSLAGLKRMRQTYLAFPIRSALSELTWTHYVALASIKDEKQRSVYKQKSVKQKLSTRELEDLLEQDQVEMIHDDTHSLPALKDPGIIRLPDKRGVVGLYPVVEVSIEKKPTLMLDQGFKNYLEIPEYMEDKVR